MHVHNNDTDNNILQVIMTAHANSNDEIEVILFLTHHHHKRMFNIKDDDTVAVFSDIPYNDPIRITDNNSKYMLIFNSTIILIEDNPNLEGILMVNSRIGRIKHNPNLSSVVMIESKFMRNIDGSWGIADNNHQIPINIILAKTDYGAIYLANYSDKVIAVNCKDTFISSAWRIPDMITLIDSAIIYLICERRPKTANINKLISVNCRLEIDCWDAMKDSIDYIADNSRIHCRMTSENGGIKDVYFYGGRLLMTHPGTRTRTR